MSYIRIEGLTRQLTPNSILTTLPAAPHFFTAQPIRSHTSQGNPRPQHTRPDNTLRLHKLTVPFQPTTRQELQSGQLNLPPNIGSSPVAKIRRHLANIDDMD